jgi:Fe-S-cluster containining protein
MSEAVRLGGAWIACRPGCHECCLGPFAISLTDAQRLREGLAHLAPDAAQRVRDRAAEYMAAISSYDDDGLPEGMDDLPCPAIEPSTGLCAVYLARPIACRTFGPALRTADGAVATCELCFEGASDEEIAACAVEMPPELAEAEVGEISFIALALAER